MDSKTSDAYIEKYFKQIMKAKTNEDKWKLIALLIEEVDHDAIKRIKEQKRQYDIDCPN